MLGRMKARRGQQLEPTRAIMVEKLGTRRTITPVKRTRQERRKHCVCVCVCVWFKMVGSFRCVQVRIACYEPLLHCGANMGLLIMTALLPQSGHHKFCQS